MESKETLGGIMREILRAGDGKTVTLGEIVQTFERRGFGPLLLVPSLILVLPTGAIPGMPIVCGLLMIFAAAQLLLGRDHPWIPDRLKQINFDSSRMQKGIEKALPWAERADRLTGKRLEWLVSPFFERLIGLYCLVVALLIIPLGAIPFAIFPPALTVLFMALGLVAGDGLLVGIGLAAAIGFSALGGAVWP